MKITIFNGSPRAEKSNTHWMVREFMKGAAEAGADCENIFLVNQKIQRAGREIAEHLRLSPETRSELEKPLVPDRQYIESANRYFASLIPCSVSSYRDLRDGSPFQGEAPIESQGLFPLKRAVPYKPSTDFLNEGLIPPPGQEGPSSGAKSKN